MSEVCTRNIKLLKIITKVHQISSTGLQPAVMLLYWSSNSFFHWSLCDFRSILNWDILKGNYCDVAIRIHSSKLLKNNPAWSIGSHRREKRGAGLIVLQSSCCIDECAWCFLGHVVPLQMAAGGSAVWTSLSHITRLQISLYSDQSQKNGSALCL